MPHTTMPAVAHWVGWLAFDADRLGEAVDAVRRVAAQHGDTPRWVDMADVLFSVFGPDADDVTADADDRTVIAEAPLQDGIALFQITIDSPTPYPDREDAYLAALTPFVLEGEIIHLAAGTDRPVGRDTWQDGTQIRHDDRFFDLRFSGYLTIPADRQGAALAALAALGDAPGGSRGGMFGTWPSLTDALADVWAAPPQDETVVRLPAGESSFRLSGGAAIYPTPDTSVHVAALTPFITDGRIVLSSMEGPAGVQVWTAGQYRFDADSAA